jgi:GNAT superfamily N-acetyltransferase
MKVEHRRSRLASRSLSDGLVYPAGVADRGLRMSEEGRIRPAVPEDADAIAAVLAEAFLDDPGAVIFEPDRVRRAAILPAFFGCWVRAALSDGGDLVVPDGPKVTGVASWFGPGRYGPSEGAITAAGWDGVLTTFGEAASARMLAMTGELERQHGLLAPWPHLRLDFFGVLPAVQGTGIGARLIDHGHRAADAAGLPCYLETFTERNVAYYGRRGWDVIATYNVGDGVPVYALVRPPSG